MENPKDKNSEEIMPFNAAKLVVSYCSMKIKHYLWRKKGPMMQKKQLLEQAVMKGAYEEGKKYLEDVGYLHEGEHIEELLDKDMLLLTKLTIGFEDHMAETLFRDEKTYMIEIDESLFGNDRIGPYHEPGSTWNILDHYFEEESEVWKWVMKGWNEVIKDSFGEKYDHDYEAEWLEVYGK